jgi:hypothetical protein
MIIIGGILLMVKKLNAKMMIKLLWKRKDFDHSKIFDEIFYKGQDKDKNLFFHKFNFEEKKTRGKVAASWACIINPNIIWKTPDTRRDHLIFHTSIRELHDEFIKFFENCITIGVRL